MAPLQDDVKQLKRILNGSSDPAVRKALDEVAGAMMTINDSVRMLAVFSGSAERRRALSLVEANTRG